MEGGCGTCFTFKQVPGCKKFEIHFMITSSCRLRGFFPLPAVGFLQSCFVTESNGTELKVKKVFRGQSEHNGNIMEACSITLRSTQKYTELTL